MIPLSPGLYLRLGAAGAVLALAAWTHWQAYSAGRHAADQERDAAILAAEQARADALVKLADANGRMLRIERDASQRIAAAEQRGAAQARTVERVIRENPDFAAVVRPADLQRVRDDDMAAIEDAARRSADLSAASVRGVRGSDSTEWGNTR